MTEARRRPGLARRTRSARVIALRTRHAPDTAHVTPACSFSTALLVLVLVLARARRRGPVHMQQPALVLQAPLCGGRRAPAGSLHSSMIPLSALLGPSPSLACLSGSELLLTIHRGSSLMLV